jgi:anti-sigma-K factor RskA
MDKNIEELLPFYALDALTGEERELVEAYVTEHPEARERIQELSHAASALPYSAPLVRPSDRPKQLLMERIEADRRTRSSIPDQSSRARPIWLENLFGGFKGFAFGALSLGIAVLAIGWVVILNREVSRLRGEVSVLGDTLVAQARSLEQLNQSIDQLNAELPQEPPSAVTTIEFNGTTVQPQAYGQLIADPNSTSAVMVVTRLAPLQTGIVYQVWLIQGDTPTSAGLLTVDADGQGVLLLISEATIGSFDALGISIEPEGGSQQPTGDIVVLGNLY